MIHFGVRLTGLLLAAVLIVGCTTVPITGRSRFMLITSPAEEEQLGMKAWKEICGKEKLTNNRKYSDAVTRVGKNIAAVSGAENFHWEFKTFESPVANAFCLPGGKVAVYTGIFKYIANDGELAAVMGHEIGHAIARHGGERITQEQARLFGQSILADLTKPQYRQLAVTVYGGATQLGVMLPYSRLHEYEADHIGLILMAKAGYNPQKAISFWKKFSKASSTSTIGEYFSTHPISEKRIAEMKKLLPEAMKYYRRSKVKR